ncbi:hypothetical protein V8C34DRAFT_277334 [Trichoderma compactum]
MHSGVFFGFIFIFSFGRRWHDQRESRSFFWFVFRCTTVSVSLVLSLSFSTGCVFLCQVFLFLCSPISVTSLRFLFSFLFGPEYPVSTALRLCDVINSELGWFLLFFFSPWGSQYRLDGHVTYYLTG